MGATGIGVGPTAADASFGRSTPQHAGIDVAATGRALGLLLATAVAAEAASRFIEARIPAPPQVSDLLLGALPYVLSARLVTSAALVGALVAFAAYALHRAPGEVPRFVAVIALAYLLRAAIMVLTPLASPRDAGAYVFPLFANGMFPSGHTALVVLLVRFTDRSRAPALQRAFVALAAIVVITLLLSRGHYSIDLVGGALLAYFVDREWSSGRLFDPLKRFVFGTPRAAERV